MKKLFFMAVAAIAALSSCTSDNDLELNQNTAKEALTFTATIEGSEATRATFDNTNKCAAWEEGDEIYVIDVNWLDNGALYKAGSDGTTTTFTESVTGKGVTDKSEGDDNFEVHGFEAYFPASIVSNYDESKQKLDERLCLELPSVIEEGYGHFNMPMYAYSTTTELSFTNLCGVLAITVKSDQMEKVKSIKVSSSNLAMSGKFTVYATDVDNVYDIIVDGYNDASKTVTVNYTDEGGVETGTAGKTFYVAIPPETYKNLKIEVSDGTTTKTMTTKKDVLIDVVRNKIYPITFKDNSAAPTNQINGHEYVELAGYYWATENVYNATGATAGNIGTSAYGSYYVQNEAIKAAASWGGTWTLPTAAQWEALLDECYWEWTDSYNGTTDYKGYIVYEAKNNDDKGKFDKENSGYTVTDKHIFLPAAGYSWLGGNAIGYNAYFQYWSSTVNNSNPEEKRGTLLSFESKEPTPFVKYDQNEKTGFTVRPVAAAPKPTKGTAMAIITQEETPIDWIQLWSGGPKFANDPDAFSFVGAFNSPEAAIKNGVFEWGANWRTPTKDELDEFVKAANGDPDAKVSYEWGQVDDKWGFIFTGKEEGYTENSKFFPGGEDEDMGCLSCWSSDGGYMDVIYAGGGINKDLTGWTNENSYEGSNAPCIYAVLNE